MTQTDTQNPDQNPENIQTAEAAQNAGQATDLSAELAQARAEAAEMKDRLLREAADKENLRRRLEREKEDAAKYAAGKFAKDILSVADNLRRALQSAPVAIEGEAGEPLRNLLAGIEATERELLAVFERNGISRVDPQGEKFDPNLHQAMFEIEDPTVAAGTVLQVVAAGYVQHGRLLRAAMVGVSKGGPQPDIQPGKAVDTEA